MWTARYWDHLCHSPRSDWIELIKQTKTNLRHRFANTIEFALRVRYVTASSTHTRKSFRLSVYTNSLLEIITIFRQCDVTALAAN